MNLEEFRVALASDATKKADAQERTIIELRGEIKRLKEYHLTKDRELVALRKENYDLRKKLRNITNMNCDGIRIDTKNPNALVTLAMLGSMWKQDIKEGEKR